jgi:hypothetical protein
MKRPREAVVDVQEPGHVTTRCEKMTADFPILSVPLLLYSTLSPQAPTPGPPKEKITTRPARSRSRSRAPVRSGRCLPTPAAPLAAAPRRGKARREPRNQPHRPSQSIRRVAEWGRLCAA